MHSIGSRIRALRVVVATAAFVLAMPGGAAAAPADEQCAALAAQTYTAPLPAGARTVGTHRIQWNAVYTDIVTGDVVEDDSIISAITIDPSATAYPNTVLVRLFRNTAILAGGEVVDVQAIRPTQDARLYVNVSWLRDEPFFAPGTFRLAYRHETTRNHWSAYAELPSSPVQSLCVESTSSIWKRGYGWS